MHRMLKRTLAVNPPTVRERGQALVIVAFAMVGLVAFIGFTVDTGILFIANGHLRRAVDAAALAAATQFREGASSNDLDRMTREFISLNGINPDALNVSVYACKEDASGNPVAPDLPLQLDTSLCVHPPRKFIRIRATQIVQFVFLPIIGFGQFPISADATSEAASVDAVIVIGGSETMAKESPKLVPGSSSYNYGDPFDPAMCNPYDAVNNPLGGATINPNSFGDGSASNPYKCRPLWNAKIAAKAFLKQMYDGYDQVAVVTFAFKPIVKSLLTANLGTDDTGTNFDSTGVYRAIDEIEIWDEATPPDVVEPLVKIHGGANPLDFACNFSTPASCPGTPSETSSWLAGCSGCGMRVAANILKTTGRPSALWVIIFLSDGVVNLADMPVDFYSDAATRRGTIYDAGISATNFPNGYCANNNGMSGYVDDTQFSNNPLWSKPFCVTGGLDLNGDGDRTDGDGNPPFYGGQSEKNFQDLSVRHCGPYNPGGAVTCPPGSIYVGALGYTTTVTPTVSTAYYDALDYARDMADQGALQHSANPYEPVAGTNLAIYSIGLGLAANPPDYAGEEFLRYMAAVGDDGDRSTDPCAGQLHATNCGNYYYAPTGAGLVSIFEDIAKRIFTRLTR